MPESGGAPPPGPSLNSALAAFLIAAEGIAALRSTPLKDRFLPSSAPSDSAKRKDCSSLCCCAARAAAPSSPWHHTTPLALRRAYPVPRRHGAPDFDLQYCDNALQYARSEHIIVISAMSSIS